MGKCLLGCICPVVCSVAGQEPMREIGWHPCRGDRQRWSDSWVKQIQCNNTDNCNHITNNTANNTNNNTKNKYHNNTNNNTTTKNNTNNNCPNTNNTNNITYS